MLVSLFSLSHNCFLVLLNGYAQCFVTLMEISFSCTCFIFIQYHLFTTSLFLKYEGVPNQNFKSARERERETERPSCAQALAQ